MIQENDRNPILPFTYTRLECGKKAIAIIAIMFVCFW